MTEQLKLEDGEQILRIVRKHWFILVAKTIGLFVAAALPLIALSLLSSNPTVRDLMPTREIWITSVFFFSTVWLLLIWMMLFTVWTDYYLDNWILTNKRVIAIDQRGFFHRRVASFRLERLQNSTVNIRGIIQTLLDFGDLEVETAGHTDSFLIPGIPNPRDIKALIQKCADEILSMHQTTPRPTPLEV